ncbi:MAG: O-antigen ligase family protein [Bacteroidetes bacterium]|nr:O-antigen ligase family protein [Bacteroidota bacterium]
MSKEIKIRDHTRFLKKVDLLLLVIFYGMVAGYFAWSDGETFNKIFKLCSRLLMTLAIYFVYKMIVNRGAIGSFGWQHSMSPVLYGVYLGLGLISFLWSTDPGYSALQWFMDIESLVFSYYFIGCFLMLNYFFPENKIKLFKVMGHAIFGLIIIFVIGYFVNPGVFMRMSHEGEEYRLGGFIMNPNELGMLAAVGISCYMFCLYEKGQRVFILIKIFIMLYAVILTGSRSTTIGCLIIAFFHINQSSNKRLKTLMYAGGAMVIPIAVNTLIVKSAGNGGVDEVMSMTGRLPFWTALITEGLPREPLLGFGFQRINYTLYFSGVHTYTASMAHNTFIQVLMNLGFIGFTIMLFQMFFTVRGFVQSSIKETKLMSIGIIIPVVINSFTEFGIFGETNYGIIFYQILIFYVSMKINPRLTPSEKKFLMKRRPEFSLA